MKQVDILAFGAHPDDVELSCAGTLASHLAMGHRCAVVDLTQGELGTRGDAQTRLREAQEAARLLGLSDRENLGLADGFFTDDQTSIHAIVQMVRHFRPELILANAPSDRHPDHGRAAALVKKASFLAGLRRIETTWQGEVQEAHRARQVLHYIQFQSLQPDLIVPFEAEHLEKKLAAVKAYRSQFYDPNSQEPETVISSQHFLESISYRAQEMGRLIGAEYGEGFIKSQDLGLCDLMQLTGVR